MSVISAHNLTKEFADRTLFADAFFAVEKGSKVGFIGANGAGKTTLFKMIIGKEIPTAGQIIISANAKIGYLEQHVCKDSELSAYEETLSVFNDLIETEKEIEKINQKLLESTDEKLIERQMLLREKFERDGGLTYQNRTAAVLFGLGFSASEIRLPTSALSGGQRSKIGLAKLLLSKNDLILLDEPTNHLDIDSITWLEDFLITFPGAAIIISHDRFFLDKVTDNTMEIENRKIYFSNGNFSRYEQLKAERVLALNREYENKQKEIKRIEGIIEQQRRWNREKNIKTAESKQKQIDRIEKTLEKPESENHNIELRFPVNSESGKRVLSVVNEQCSFGDKTLYSSVNFEIFKSERVCLIGPNGIGKTTLIKRLVSKENKEFEFGVGVTVGYFDQFQSNIREKSTPFDEIHDVYPQKTDTQVRNALAAFEFKGDDVFKSTDSLSGGEKARVALCKLVLSGNNFLVLDEPTNHLDIYSRKALEDALAKYEGTLLIISHDRYFINRIATKTVALSQNGVTVVKGNYDDYLDYIMNSGTLKTSAPDKELKEAVSKKGKEAYINSKKKQSYIRKLTSAVKKAEDEISKLEAENSNLKAEISNAGSDYQKLTELTLKLQENEKLIEEKMQSWEQANLNLENIDG